MKEEKSAEVDHEYGFTDLFFEKGHYLLKIRQILCSIIGWIFFFVPTFITIANYLYFLSHGRIGWQLWKYTEGLEMIHSLMIILAFAVVMIFTFTVSMTLIQNNRRESFVEKWPTFDTVSSIERQKRASVFMSSRFGSAEFRQNVRYFDVTPDKNLGHNELARIINNEEENPSDK